MGEITTWLNCSNGISSSIIGALFTNIGALKTSALS
jgi:hypothetical protein